VRLRAEVLLGHLRVVTLRKPLSARCPTQTRLSVVPQCAAHDPTNENAGPPAIGRPGDVWITPLPVPTGRPTAGASADTMIAR
jgi:hypothetical protein